ncbi:CLUMA_CG005627, isoform A [Clunio marinus]|uniref:CLUMA_CG005627, isoform A n=1 Tax=Clunio marinus TaxID=568069 RepID=A0A1J1HVE8_9DIPT|nr:CLUMA_CG005627, isoform A [Clunio marinus]
MEFEADRNLSKILFLLRLCAARVLDVLMALKATEWETHLMNARRGEAWIGGNRQKIYSCCLTLFMTDTKIEFDAVVFGLVAQALQVKT